MSSTRNSPTLGLVLPGGGARGAYQVGALQAIAEIAPRGRNPFPVIMGASVGSINAVSIATSATNFRRGVTRLTKFWQELRTSNVYRTDLPTILKRGGQWVASLTPLGSLGVPQPRSLLDNEPLGHLLRHRIDLSRISKAIHSGALRAVGVTASSYDRSRAVTFFEGAPGIEEWVRARRIGVPCRLSIEHMLASTALPFVFEAQRIGTEYYGDGSLRLTSPLSPAIHCGADRILVIGIRDTRPEPADTSGTETPYPGLGYISGYLLDTIFMDNLDSDIERARRINRTIALLPPDVRSQTALRDTDILVLQPSRDIRDIARSHADEMPWTIRMLLRRIGVWGRDWRLPSYLLFEPGYCRALIGLGYADTMARKDEIRAFLAGEPAPTAGSGLP